VLIRLLIATLLVYGMSFSSAAVAEECPTYNFSEVFYADYYPNTPWASKGQKRLITWSSSATLINDEYVNRDFTLQEIDWLKTAISTWDVHLDSIEFSYIQSQSADLVIGFVPLVSAVNQPGAYGYWNAWWDANKIRYRGTIKLKSGSSFLDSKERFIHAVQHEVGNVLGLGDTRPNLSFESVLEDPWQIPFGPDALSDYDVGLVRQMYGESTCPSSWKTATQVEAEAKAKAEAEAEVKAKAEEEAKAKVEAEAKAKAEEEAKAKVEAEAKAKAEEEAEAEAKAKAEAEAKAKAEEEAGAEAKVAKKKSTITCTKGKKVKKVKAVKPKCPKGYKKK
jgi:hypothetical protein